MIEFPKKFRFKSLISGEDIVLTVKGTDEKKDAIIDVI